MNNIDVRWQQRLSNFRKVLLQLDEAMELMQQRELSKLEKQGAIQGFEYCYELGWNTLKGLSCLARNRWHRWLTRYHSRSVQQGLD